MPGGRLECPGCPKNAHTKQDNTAHTQHFAQDRLTSPHLLIRAAAAQHAHQDNRHSSPNPILPTKNSFPQDRRNPRLLVESLPRYALIRTTDTADMLDTAAPLHARQDNRHGCTVLHTNPIISTPPSPPPPPFPSARPTRPVTLLADVTLSLLWDRLYDRTSA